MGDQELRDRLSRMKALVVERMNQSREATNQKNENERWYHKGRYESYQQVLAMLDMLGVK